MNDTMTRVHQLNESRKQDTKRITLRVVALHIHHKAESHRMMPISATSINA